MPDNHMFVQQVLALLAKDLKAEWRTREIFSSMFVFAILVVVVFNFAIGANPELIRQVAPGVLWVALLFATVLGLQRAVQMESEEDCLQGVLLAVGDRSALFIAKTVANMIYLLIVAVCTLPLFSIWFRIDIASRFAPLVVTIGSVYATAKLIDGKGLAEVKDYLTLMGVFDVVFVVLALLIFDYVVEE
jgi:heme exporter protein B